MVGRRRDRAQRGNRRRSTAGRGGAGPRRGAAVTDSAVDEVAALVSALIRFDTSNTGDPETTRGERQCAEWVAEQLHEVGYETVYVESGMAGRGNVFARLPGAAASS